MQPIKFKNNVPKAQKKLHYGQHLNYLTKQFKNDVNEITTTAGFAIILLFLKPQTTIIVIPYQYEDTY